MFERFTDRARRVVVLAQEEARLKNHSYIGTEHLVLGLLREEEGIAARALGSLGFTLDESRKVVTERVGTGTATPQGHIPFTPRSKKALEMSLREALQLGHDYIGTEHILLGLIREGEGVGAQILAARADLPSVREAVIQAMHRGKESPPPDVPSPTTEVVIMRTLNEILKRLDAIEERLGPQPPAATG